MKRRQFLAAASAAAGMVQMPWLSAAARGDAADKILVAVELSGGNDGKLG